MMWRDSAALHAAAEYPREACGLVVRIDGGGVYWPCRNLAQDGQSFVMSPDDMVSAEDCGREIVGIVHSHPDEVYPRASAYDVASCDSSGLPWHILGWPSGQWLDFAPRRQIPPLLGREFAHGRLDCYSLIRDWYRLERGIVLPDFERSDEWWKKGGDIYLDGYERAGFRQVQDAEPGDGMLFRVGSRVPNHAGVYMGDDTILHHLHGRLSCREPLGGVWLDRLVMVVRYEH